MTPPLIHARGTSYNCNFQLHLFLFYLFYCSMLLLHVSPLTSFFACLFVFAHSFLFLSSSFFRPLSFKTTITVSKKENNHNEVEVNASFFFLHIC